MEMIERILATIGLLVIASVPYYLGRALYWRWKGRQLEALLDERLAELETELIVPYEQQEFPLLQYSKN